MEETIENRSAKEFFDQIVLPCHEAWKSSSDRRNQEWLVRAVIGFFNDLVEYDAVEKGVTPGKHRKKLRIVHPLGIITDIANGTKHVKLINNNKVVTNSSSSFIEENIDSWGLIDDAPNFDGHAVFLVVLDDGKEFDVDDLINAALFYWQPVLEQREK